MTESAQFRKQIETSLGVDIEVVWESVLQRRVGIADRAEFRRQLERFTRTLDLEEVLAGRETAKGIVIFLASMQRGGVLIQLRELKSEASKIIVTA